MNFRFPVFARFSALNLSAEDIAHKLSPIANAEHRNSEPEYFFRAFRSVISIHTAWSAGKNNSNRIFCLNFFNCTRIGKNLAINIMLTHAARNELVILSAEIDYDHCLLCHYAINPL